MKNSIAKKVVLSLAAATMMSACDKGSVSYSLLDAESKFKPQATVTPMQIDILWVIDNSGSMRTSQDNLTANFQSFISKFKQQNYDFHMAVTTTEAWEKEFVSSSVKARLKSGARLSSSVTTNSGVTIMDRDTPNLDYVFTTNATQGTLGNGDERAFASIEETLKDHNNASFRRDSAFLAVIIVSDEEDFSRKVKTFSESYSDSNLRPVSYYVDFLDRYVGSKNYTVNTISVKDSACRNQLLNASGGAASKISTRLPELAGITGGISASICSDFASSLTLISDSIISLSTVFRLNREPQVDTIKVTIDGVDIPQSSTNGWSYNAAEMSISFSGSAIPKLNSQITVDFKPAGIIL